MHNRPHTDAAKAKMSALHREWGNAQADRVVLVVDQVASVKSAPAHQPS